MKKISDWFKKHFEFKDEEETTIEKFTFEEEEERKFKFSKPLIPDDEDVEVTEQAVFYTKQSSPQVEVKRPTTEYKYETSEVISPFFGKQKKAEDEVITKDKPKKVRKEVKRSAVISPFFGAVEGEEEAKPVIEVDEKEQNSDVQLNFEDLNDDHPDDFDELREWYKDEK